MRIPTSHQPARRTRASTPWLALTVVVVVLSLTSVRAEPAGLWSVDFQGTGTPVTMSGVEPVYGYGGVWNNFRLLHVPGTSNTASANLADDGGAVNAFLLIFGRISGANGPGGDALNSDYMVLNNGIADASTRWAFWGLTPGATYEMFVYGGDMPGFGFTMTIDKHGDGSLLDDTPEFVDFTHRLISGITATTTACPTGAGAFGGCIVGEVVAAAGEARWSGFQIRATPFAAPVANAGVDQVRTEGDMVQFDGTASSPTGVTYSWAQVAGFPLVTLSDPASATPSFVAPLLPLGFGGTTLTFELTVTNPAGSSTDVVDITMLNVNHAPVADAGVDQTVNEGSATILDGAASYDPDGDALAYLWVQTAGPAVALTGPTTASPSFPAPLLSGGLGGPAILEFRLTVSDGALAHSDTVRVTVEQVNHRPVANAGPPQTVHSGAAVVLDGTGSSDPDLDPISYAWTQVTGPAVTLTGASTSHPTFTAPSVSGTAALLFRLIVNDGALISDPSDVVIAINNATPRCDLALASPALLWPPNHGMHSVGITNVTDPDDTTTAIVVTGVTQDEPVNGQGDGDTSPDAVLQGATALIRAERAGGGDGRVYSVMFTANDSHGGTCTGTVQVGVPKSMKPGAGPIDSGQLYNSTLP